MNLDLDRLEALMRGYAPEDRVMVQSRHLFTFGDLSALIAAARELALVWDVLGETETKTIPVGADWHVRDILKRLSRSNRERSSLHGALDRLVTALDRARTDRAATICEDNELDQALKAAREELR